MSGRGKLPRPDRVEFPSSPGAVARALLWEAWMSDGGMLHGSALAPGGLVVRLLGCVAGGRGAAGGTRIAGGRGRGDGGLDASGRADARGARGARRLAHGARPPAC